MTVTKTPDELLAAALTYVAELRSRAAEIDELRQLPQDLADRFAAEGFYRMCTPAALGGVDIDPGSFAEVCEILGTGSGSAAWCVFIGATSQYTFAGLEPAQLNLMLENPNVITSGVFASTGTAVAETRNGEEGFLIDGSWAWGSGCRNAAWISGGVSAVPATGDSYQARAYFTPAELDIVDDWFTSGLRGSGSSTFRVHNLWLPKQRLTDPRQQSPYAHEPHYRFPQFAMLCIAIGSLSLGMASSAITEAGVIATSKTPTGSRRSLGHRASMQHDLAFADTARRAARTLLYSTIAEVWDHVQHQDPTLDHRLRLRTATAYAVTTSAEIISNMYRTVGGSSVFSASGLQRNFRDVHVATQHMMVAEPVMELAGRVLLDLDDTAQGL